MPAGYSSNPLTKKLGIKENFKCLILHEPDHYVELLEEIPHTAEFTDDPSEGEFDFIHLFVTRISDLKANWPICKSSLKKTGFFWISWPKQTSEIQADLNANDVRKFGLDGGLVDTKVCAVDHDWSGLKFMYRKEDRNT